MDARMNTGKNKLRPMFDLTWFNSETLLTDIGFYIDVDNDS